MERQELTKDSRSPLGSLDALSWPKCRSALAETLVALEPELLHWATPLDDFEQATLLPNLEIGGTLSSMIDSTCPTCLNLTAPATLPGIASLQPASQTACLQPPPDCWSFRGASIRATSCSDSQTSSTEASSAFNLPLGPVIGLSSSEFQAIFWEEQWDSPANSLGSEGPPREIFAARPLSPVCSLGSESGAPCLDGSAPADKPCLAQRTSSTHSDSSCAFDLILPEDILLPNQLATPADLPQAAQLQAADAASAAVDRAPPASPAAACRSPPAAAAAGPVSRQPPAQRRALAAPAPAGRPAPLPPPRAAVGVPPAVALRGQRLQPLAKIQKIRWQQKEYNIRKKVRLLLLCMKTHTGFLSNRIRL